MKTLLAAAFGALMLSGSVATYAATMPAQANGAVVLAQTTSMTAVAGHSEALPTFIDAGSVPVTANVGPSNTNSVLPWNVNLANQRGGER